MSASLQRVGAIMLADFRIRFRRISTLVAFLLISAFAYLWIPAPSTGRALLMINGHRAILNSGAIGLGTASLGMLFVGLFGFYFISNTIRRDVTTRCGLVAASTPMRSLEYLFGKFVGNLAFLTAFLGGFMLTSMAMLLVRGEAPLQPLIFLEQYLILTPPAIVFVSAVAVLFESILPLSGKFGDVVYFFLWIGVFSVVVGNEVSHHRMNWAHCVDFTGFGFMIDQMQQKLHTNSVSIGAAPFDPRKTPVDFQGLKMTSDWVIPRAISLVAPLLLLPPALLFFPRFDPVRTGRVSEKGSRNWISRLQTLFKPISRRAVAILSRLGGVFGTSMPGKIWQDASLTFTLYPLTFLALLGCFLATLIAPLPATLPIVFAVLAIAIADVATRDVRAGTLVTLRAIRGVRENYVWWKLGSNLLVALLFCLGAIARTAPWGGFALFALLGGIFFIASMATALGVVTQNAKTFIVGSLSFWYLVVNDHGVTPVWDFAGWYGRASAGVITGYVIVSLAAIFAAEALHRFRLVRT